MPGNGQPATDVPSSQGAPATSSVPGTSSGSAPVGHLVAAGPAGMTSASIDAATTLAADQAYRGKVLGASDPGPNPYAGMQLPPRGQFIPPSLTANPEATVNSSISSPPIPVITAGADLTGATGLFFATASAAAPAVVGAPGTGAGVTAPMTNVGTTAVINGSATTANADVNGTNNSGVLVPGQFAAGVGGGTALLGGNVSDMNPAIANPGPLAVAPGTVLGNGNTGTFNPTISSALTPNPTVAANPPVVAGNGTVFPAGPRTAAVKAPAAAGSQAVGTITIGGGTANRATSAVTAAGRNAIAAARLGSLNMTSSAPAVVQSQSGRVRAASRVTGSATAPVTVSASRIRSVRITTAPDGSIVVTNTSATDNQSRRSQQ